MILWKKRVNKMKKKTRMLMSMGSSSISSQEQHLQILSMVSGPSQKKIKLTSQSQSKLCLKRLIRLGQFVLISNHPKFISLTYGLSFKTVRKVKKVKERKTRIMNNNFKRRNS